MHLEKGILVAEGNQHSALVPASGKQALFLGRDQASGQLLVISLRLETDMGLSHEHIGFG